MRIEEQIKMLCAKTNLSSSEIARRLNRSTVQVRIVLIWTHRKEVCHKTTIDTQIDYLAPKTLTFTNLPDIPVAKTICIKLYFENDLMCCMEQSLADAEVIR